MTCEMGLSYFINKKEEEQDDEEQEERLKEDPSIQEIKIREAKVLASESLSKLKKEHGVEFVYGEVRMKRGYTTPQSMACAMIDCYFNTHDTKNIHKESLAGAALYATFWYFDPDVTAEMVGDAVGCSKSPIYSYWKEMEEMITWG